VEPLVEAGALGGAGLFMIAPDAAAAAQAGTVSGTTEWQYREMLLDIPRGTQWLPIGVMLIGRGQVWARDLKFEEVPAGTQAAQPAMR
jgi:hypothetical protein